MKRIASRWPGMSLILAAALVFGSAREAAAHVKWFFPYDLSQPPLPIGEVITQNFIYLFLVSVGCIYAFYWVDRFLYRQGFMAERLGRLVISQPTAFWIMRVAASILFLALFIYGLTEQSFYLTPELVTDNGIVKWLHLAAAAAVWHRRTVPLTGLLIYVLFGLAIADYGIYHMLDYLIFFGIGVYFSMSFMERPIWVRARYVNLYAATGLTLLWASIEKWGYPGWTYPLLAENPTLRMGLSPEFYMLLAGFIEFNITFILLSSASIFSRFIALGLNGIFIIAIFEFGLIDAIGHLMIIAILTIMTARGPTSARYFLVLADRSLWTEAYFMTGLYVLALNVIFLAYYGLYFLLY